MLLLKLSGILKAEYISLPMNLLKHLQAEFHDQGFILSVNQI